MTLTLELDTPLETATLPANLTAFGRALRARKVDVTAGRLLDSARSLGLIDLVDRDQFYLALRANTVSSPRDLPVFDELFEQFWRSGDFPGEQPGRGRVVADQESYYEGFRYNSGAADDSQGGETDWLIEDANEVEDLPEESPAPGYSPNSSSVRKDFSRFSDAEVAEISRIVTMLGRKLATRLSRRLRPTPRDRGRIDLRRSMRKNLRYGDILKFQHRNRRPGKTKVVVLCDVSGSMDVYSRFLIQFLFALQNRLANVETFVFGTRLTRVTHVLRQRNLGQSLGRIAQLEPDWSGGTNISASLRQFNDDFATALLTRRTLVVIMSDGWDRGEPAFLEREMQRLKLNCYRILWLNPLLGNPDYRPIYKEIRACLPYIDHFLPAHNVASLAAVGETLTSVVK